MSFSHLLKLVQSGSNTPSSSFTVAGGSAADTGPGTSSSSSKTGRRGSGKRPSTNTGLGGSSAGALLSSEALSPTSDPGAVVRQSFITLKAGRKRAVLLARQHAGHSAHSTHAEHADGGTSGSNAGDSQTKGMTRGSGSAASTRSAGGGFRGQSAAPALPLQLAGLRIRLGPDLRAVVPVLLNLGLSGEIVLYGPVDDLSRLAPQGVLELESGSLNLVAARLELDREHANRLVFTPSEGGAGGGLMDPYVDVVLTSGDLRAAIQVCVPGLIAILGKPFVSLQVHTG